MNKRIKVAAVQMDCNPGNIENNLEKIGSLIDKSAQKGVRLAVLPELSNISYDLTQIRNLDYDFNASRGFVAGLAKKNSIWIAAGMLELEDNKYYNSLFVFDDNGRLAAKYRKINLFPLGLESSVFLKGDQMQTFLLDDFRFGLMICFDLRFAGLALKYREMDCHCFIYSSAFPFPRLDHFRILCQARAIENQVYVISCNRTGTDGNLTFLGNSSVIDPWGTLLASTSEKSETIVISELYLDEIYQVRKHLPMNSFNFL